jgi:hypothetical protein
MTRFYQKFDIVPKFSLRGQLGGLSINKKYRVWTRALMQAIFKCFSSPFCMSDSLQCTIDDALRECFYQRLEVKEILARWQVER